MANKYAGTQTEKNLMEAFAGESQARNKYTYFASKAKKEGFEQISSLFLKTADNEKEHAKMWFKELNGIGNTAENLAAAAEGENYEWTDHPAYVFIGIRGFRARGQYVSLLCCSVTVNAGSTLCFAASRYIASRTGLQGRFPILCHKGFPAARHRVLPLSLGCFPIVLILFIVIVVCK